MGGKKKNCGHDKEKKKKIKVDKYGAPKRRKGDWRHGMIVRHEIVRQPGKKRFTVGERKCAIHAKCDCLRKSDYTAMSTVYTR